MSLISGECEQTSAVDVLICLPYRHLLEGEDSGKLLSLLKSLKEPYWDSSILSFFLKSTRGQFGKACSIVTLRMSGFKSYISIRNIVVLVLAVSYFASVYLGQSIRLKMLVERIFIVSKRFLGVPSFFSSAIADGIFSLLYPDKTALPELNPIASMTFSYALTSDSKTQETPKTIFLTRDISFDIPVNK